MLLCATTPQKKGNNETRFAADFKRFELSPMQISQQKRKCVNVFFLKNDLATSARLLNQDPSVSRSARPFCNFAKNSACSFWRDRSTTLPGAPKSYIDRIRICLGRNNPIIPKGQAWKKWVARSLQDFPLSMRGSSHWLEVI